MYSVQAKSIGMYGAMKSKVQNKRSFSKLKAVQGIGDVVHINVYESLTKRLESIENKLFQIETHMANEPLVTQEDNVTKPNVMEPERVVVSQPFVPKNHFYKNNEVTKQVQDLKMQLDDATSDVRRKALYKRIQELKINKNNT
jgi:hypothetical protein